MNLSECPLRTRARIVDPAVSDKYLLRFQELGIRPGADFTAVNRSLISGVVINIGGTRIAVDRGSARKMEVEIL
ncbi:ferrous iron transport protein A [Actinomycetaceae bacterium WB03_NA08]|uniref:Ferrous iron transport protein A n=1 Tax=Scrofimicrobium canadense TaxID=2652290 RepID=A0A6N7W6U3_9ACTO|nr:FeoA family protein [Scrofimicrobium canadense]MSS84142.1 ferrous iron transport protein A [Scrofimicrobium canadense]